ncbi:hypothetical protein [Paraflavitalea speifideaquila]|uniref:hypothetical protein n=1 Tax=Paraflavitalea speifideaquila TaxID=3076558 RepID=UPI0028EC421E|nr:hypothetical protein [Paraflavitalea speifideiaquila]
MRVFIVIVVFFVTYALHAETTPRLDSLLQRRQYFELRKVLSSAPKDQLPEHRRLYFQAFVNNFFHEGAASNKDIEELFKSTVVNSPIRNWAGYWARRSIIMQSAMNINKPMPPAPYYCLNTGIR